MASTLSFSDSGAAKTVLKHCPRFSSTYSIICSCSVWFTRVYDTESRSISRRWPTRTSMLCRVSLYALALATAFKISLDTTFSSSNWYPPFLIRVHQCSASISSKLSVIKTKCSFSHFLLPSQLCSFSAYLNQLNFKLCLSSSLLSQTLHCPLCWSNNSGKTTSCWHPFW